MIVVKIIAGVLMLPVFLALIPIGILAYLGALLWEIFTGDSRPLDVLLSLGERKL